MKEEGNPITMKEKVANLEALLKNAKKLKKIEEQKGYGQNNNLGYERGY
ncbi:MAG: hypothetical protein PVJ67_00525 [Candidatus Pacearchaeota archaeon]|jgi:hypothetical protein